MSGAADPEKVAAQMTIADHAAATTTKEAVAEDGENAALGQAPLMVAPAPAPAPLTRLDSQLPEKTKDKEEQEENDPFKHLPAHEKEILKRQLEIPTVKVNYMTLFRYASRNDMIIMVLSAIGAIIGGALLPLLTVGSAEADVLVKLIGCTGNFWWPRWNFPRLPCRQYTGK